MRFTEKGLNALAFLEGKITKDGKHKIYNDQNGQLTDVFCEGATIGYGHLIVSEDEFDFYRSGLTESEALDLLKVDLSIREPRIIELLKADVKDYEFDAITIFVFNIGVNGFKNSSALKYINNPLFVSEYGTFEKAWKAWNKSQGKVMNGLIARRNAEWKIYNGEYV